MKFLKQWMAASAVALMSMSGAQAAIVSCGDLSLGLRETTVNPALSCFYAGLTNLGDPALVDLMNDELGLVTPDTAEIINRDTANTNGGALNITGVGALLGTWSFAETQWDSFERLFLYFHFGDGPDNPGPGSTTDPDIFIVELNARDFTGDWSFNGRNGLSNIALIGSGEGGGGGDDEVVPEPGTITLAGLALLGLAATRRRARRGA